MSEKAGGMKINTVNERIEILKEVSIFSEANTEILNRIASSLEDVIIRKDDSVFHKGDELNAMYIIVSGAVKVHDGNYIFTEFGPKDFFGEYSLIDSSFRSASVTATLDTHLLRLNQDNFLKIIEDNVEVTKAVLKALIKRLRNNNILEERLTQNSLKIQKQRDKLDKQKKELEELNATKDKFFTIIAHDLKNPFNTVIGLAELLIDRYETYDNNKIKEFITQIHNFSNNAYNLLEDLLQWAKSQTGRMEVKLEKIDVFELAVENMNMYEEKANRKDIKLVSNIPIGLYAYVDRNMLTTVFRNLISNAVKFTNKGGSIILNASKIDEYIEVRISDTGVGISETNLKKIFNIDSNLSTIGTADEAGTGLGLIIVKEFIEKNKGLIKVTSKEGVGTEFVFTVPVVKDLKI